MRSSSLLSGLRRAIRIDLLLTLALCGSLVPRWANAQTYEVLHSFTGPTSDGNDPGFILVEPDGTIYGTTVWGGTSYTNGTAFKLSPEGKETILYNFNAAYGAWPYKLLAWNGEFYGSTYQGGAHRAGAIFKLDKTGNEVVLYSFPYHTGGPGLDLVDDKGNFYGTTHWSGAYGAGSIFKMDSSGKLTTLYSFTGGGEEMPCCLVRDNQGNLYGVTEPQSPGSGTVFKLDTTGQLTTLYTFTGGADGEEASTNLVLDGSGNLYGGTGDGGDLNCQSPYGCGTIFMLDPSGNKKVLYSFTGPPDGEDPWSLIRDAAGNLYGTTYGGGDPSCRCGTIFKLDSNGKETVLYAIPSFSDGRNPQSLVFGKAGEFYGTTYIGGDSSCGGAGEGCGTVFKLTP